MKTKAGTGKKTAKSPVRKAKKTASKKAAAKPARTSKKAAAKKKPAKKKTPQKAAPQRAATTKRVRKKSRPPLDLPRFRRCLRQKREELVQAFNNTKGDSRDRQSDGTEDYIDYAVSSYDREFLLSLTELEQKQLMLVEEALERIKRRKGEYGRCAQCSEEIPGKRLEVQPWARYCLRCQELDERGLLIEDDSDGDDDDRSADDRDWGEEMADGGEELLERG